MCLFFINITIAARQKKLPQHEAEKLFTRQVYANELDTGKTPALCLHGNPAAYRIRLIP
jgi:hypothetical protein